MGEEKLSLSVLAKLEGDEADREWAKIQKIYAGEIKKEFRSIKSVVSVEPDKGLAETIRWAREKLPQKISSARKQGKKIQPLSTYLSDIVKFVHEIELVEAIKKKGSEDELAWAEIEHRYRDYFLKFFETLSNGSLADAESLLDGWAARSHNNLKEKKYDPNKGDIKTFLKNIANSIPRGKTKKLRKEYRPYDSQKETKDGAYANPFEVLGIEIPPDIPESMFAQEMLCVALEFGGKPHQLIAFGFTRLIDRAPSFFVNYCSDEVLGGLADIFCKDYYARWIPFLDYKAYRQKCFGNFFKKLKLPVKKEYKIIDDEEKEEYKRLELLLNRKIGALTMRPFYVNSPNTGEVSKWSTKIKHNMKAKYRIRQDGLIEEKTNRVKENIQ